MVNLDFGNRGTRSKKPKKQLFGGSKGSAKEIVLVFKTLCVGLSFGSGILGALYLTTLGLPEFVAAIFGVGVVGTHVQYIVFMNKGEKND